MAKKPIALIIMDGYGINQNTEGNAIVAAKKPHLDKLLAEYPHSQLSASGLDVGLPDGQMGNSEVGHTNIGAGRIVYQMLVKISKDINDGKIYENKALSDAMDAAKANGKSLHLMGLLSNGGVHSHNEHLYGLLKMAKKKGIENVYVHTFLDGRDVPPTSGAEFMAELEKEIKEIGVGSVATIMGRFYAMDRDNAWDRVEKAYKAMVDGEGIQKTDAVTAVKNSYANDVTDEFVIPTVVDKNGMIKEGDSVIDVGTGSGILMIAADRLGASEIYGTDIDELAVESAKENLELNKIDENKAKVFKGDLISVVENKKFDVVVANILADVLLILLNDISKVVKKDGLIIFSGIIEDKCELLKKEVEALGFNILEVKADREWRAMLIKAN